ncbi:hypothetical protein Glo7428_0678 [Gloeocapsa sp. PCC 7428]|uniref:hypothetical protein n=1 Tax=Gloeocapsa sp. PCC 7428 TaxID=1173026 RepID=UPI0002A5C1EB|nr:hypothetical protein [Gloeocapsa sp. PCC 7428]AFZ29270.1 hypothetical protein Glo7428_0678 [Gloeocapsa sp. PCC 7428]
MLREKLKQELDKLSDEQLKKVADFIAQYKQGTSSLFWQKATSAQTREFREWVSQLPKNSPSLPNEAFSRDSLYEE